MGFFGDSQGGRRCLICYHLGYVISKIQNVVLSVDHISQKILNSVHTRQKLIFLGLVSRYFLQTLNFIERCKQLRIDFAPLTFYFCIQHFKKRRIAKRVTFRLSWYKSTTRSSVPRFCTSELETGTLNKYFRKTKRSVEK